MATSIMDSLYLFLSFFLSFLKESGDRPARHLKTEREQPGAGWSAPPRCTLSHSDQGRPPQARYTAVYLRKDKAHVLALALQSTRPAMHSFFFLLLYWLVFGTVTSGDATNRDESASASIGACRQEVLMPNPK